MNRSLLLTMTVGASQRAKTATFLIGALVCAHLSIAFPVHANDSAKYSEYRNYLPYENGVPEYANIGDSIDLYTGELTVKQVDFSVPGKGLDIKIARSYKGQQYYKSALHELGNWSLDLPTIEGEVAELPDGSSTWPANRCSDFDRIDLDTIPTGGTYGRPIGAINQGFSLVFEGKSRSLVRATNPLFPAGTIAVSSDFWRLSCIQATNVSGEGFLAISPGGVKIEFQYLYYYPSTNSGPWWNMYNTEYNPSGIPELRRKRAVMRPSRMMDKYGNYISFQYNSLGHITQITSNDGRSVTFSYVPYAPCCMSGQFEVISSITANGRTWNYKYFSYTPSPIDGMILSEVTRPDGTKWTFSYSQDGQNTPRAFTIRSPLGAVVKFSYQGYPYPDAVKSCYFSRSNVPYITYRPTENSSSVPLLLKDVVTHPISKKELSGPGLTPLTWTYSRFSDRAGWYAGSAAGTTTKVVTVTFPDRSIGKYTFSTLFDWAEGTLVRHEVFANPSAAIPQSSVTYAYQKGTVVGATSNQALNSARLSQEPRFFSVALAQNGDSYTTRYDSYDVFNNPVSITRLNSFSSVQLKESRTYTNNTTSWILGKLTTVSINGILRDKNIYNSLLDLTQQDLFGLRVQSISYLSDGSISAIADGLNRQTTYSEYYRGIPGRITRPDGSSILYSIDTFGRIAAVTDARGNRTAFARDSMGRLTEISYPSGDTQSWYAPKIQYSSIVQSEFGFPAGTRKEIYNDGRLKRSTYYDALMRPALIEERDQTTGVASYTRMQQDFEGRTTFVSYPSVNPDAPTGVSFLYDALGRLYSKESAGVESESVTYLSGNRKRTRDATGFETTYSYQAFGEPSYLLATLIEAPEGQTTAISRDIFGYVLNVKQSGSTASATRSYVYDQYRRICKRVEPESSQTIIAYNAASQISWIADGQSGVASSCGNTTAPANAVRYSYDSTGRKIKVDYPDSSGDVVLTYDPDGRLASVVNPTASWTYTWNKRGLLESERASIDGKAFVLDPAYTAQGSLAGITYPDGRKIVYSPDAWGRPTRIGTFADSITYHPNGVVSSYRLANGLSYSATLNARMWPEIVQVKGTSVLQKLTYQYNAAADITAAIDGVDGTDSLTLTYDGLHRLIQAKGLWGSYGYSYDALNNLKARTGSRAIAYTYSAASNRLGALSGSVSRIYQYDTQGRVTTDGQSTFSWNEADQLTGITGKATYGYDGHGKRIKTIKSDGAQYVLYDLSGRMMYSEKGQEKVVYAQLSDKPFMELKQTGSVAAITYLHPDLFGSPMLATDSVGNQIWREHYEPYGHKMNGIATRAGFTGHTYDSESGLTYAQARYYDAAVGRFISIDPDPNEFAPSDKFSFNRYAYGNNNPYKFVDPNGESALLMLGKLIYKGGDIVATTAGIVEDAQTIANPDIPVARRIGAALSIASELGPVSYRDAKILSAAAKKGSDILKNAAQGKVGEAIVRTKLGDTIAGEKVMYKTSDGTRAVPDFTTESGTGFGVVEAKTNGGNLTANQKKLFDDIEGGKAVTPVGQNAARAGLEPGQPIKLEGAKLEKVDVCLINKSC